MGRRIPVGRPADLPPGEARIVALADGREIAVFNVDGAYFAIDNRCPHKGGAMAKGPVDGTLVTCPLHGFQVDLRDGGCPWNPRMRVATYPVVVDERIVSVEV